MRTSKRVALTASVALVVALCGSLARSDQSSSPRTIKLNRTMESITFIETGEPDTYHILVRFSTRRFTTSSVDMSSTVQLLVNKVPVRGGSVSLPMQGHAVSGGDLRESCQQFFDPINSFVSAGGCTCQFGCNYVGVCDDPDGDGTCACNQPALAARIQNVEIRSGDVVTALVLPSKGALPEVIREDDSGSLIFREGMALRQEP